MSNVIYVGPTIMSAGIKQYEVYTNGLPAYLEPLIDATPEIGVLIVPVEQSTAAIAAVRTPGTPEHDAYATIAASLSAVVPSQSNGGGGGGGGGGGNQGNGDMSKAVYDTDNDGVVDRAERLQTKRTFTLEGFVNGSVDFDGSSNVTIVTDADVATGSNKGLMSPIDKTKLDGIEPNANNYTHPATHPPSIIAQDSSNRFVTDAEKTTWNAKASTAIATASANGLMSSADKTKLDGISGNGSGFNVKSYGAVGNDTADDTQKIKDTITAAVAAGGGTVFLPAGTYKITSAITIPSQVILVGEGRGVTNIHLADGANVDMIILDGTTNNNGIRDLTIKGNAWGGAASVGKTGLIVGKAGLSGANNDGTVNNMYIHNVQIRDIGGDGFKCFPNTWTYFIDDFTVEFCHGYGMLVQSTDNTYSQLKITANGKAGIYVSGSNNRFTNSKTIFNGRGQSVAGSTDGSTGTDAQNSGVYCTGKRNQFTAVECQENYGNGFTFDGASDILISDCFADANGYGAIDTASNNTALKRTATAYGWYFTNSSARITGMIQSTIFKPAISQIKGYQIDAGCANITLFHENDHVQADTNNSTASCVVMSAKNFADVMQSTNYTLTKQTADFIHSGNTLTNAIAAYNDTYFNLSAGWLTSYTIGTNEIQNAMTNWASLPRLGTRYFTVTPGRTYLIRFKVKPATNNYKIKMIALYDEGAFNKIVPDIDGVYSNSAYADITFIYTADRSSSKLVIYLDDKNTAGGANSAQGTMNLKEFAFIDITDMLALYYTAGALDTVVKNNYFVGARTFT